MSHPLAEPIFAIGNAIDDSNGRLAKALWGVFESANVSDANGEPANVVDALAHIAKAIYALADAVRPRESAAAPVQEPANSGVIRIRIPDELAAPRRAGRRA